MEVLLSFQHYCSLEPAALLDSISPQVAVGVSSIIMIFTGLSSTLTFMKHKTVDYKAGLIFFIGSAPGGIIGAYVNKILDIDSFSLYFGLFMILIAIILVIKDYVKPLMFKKGKGKIIRTYLKGKSIENLLKFVLIILGIQLVCQGMTGQ